MMRSSETCNAYQIISTPRRSFVGHCEALFDSRRMQGRRFESQQGKGHHSATVALFVMIVPTRSYRIRHDRFKANNGMPDFD